MYVQKSINPVQFRCTYIGREKRAWHLHDLKHLSPQILLLFVTTYDLKHLLPQILLLFVTADNITRPHWHRKNV